MTQQPRKEKKRLPGWGIAALIVFLVLTVAGIFLYNNFNRLLAAALQRTFDSSLVSDVYELRFEKLRLNVWERSIRVFHVSLQPRDKPLKTYPYINSTFSLKTEKITLMKVKVFTLLESNILDLERISITKPEINLLLDGEKNIFLPFKDSATVSLPAGAESKKAVESFVLGKFELDDASFHARNLVKHRAFDVLHVSVTLDNLLIDQRPGEDHFAFRQVDLSIGEFNSNLRKGAVKHARFKDFKIGIDSLNVTANVDTLVFRLHDFSAGLGGLDVLTEDSLYRLTMESFDLSYRKKSVNITNMVFKSNISHAAMQNRFTYLHSEVSGSAGSISLREFHFDSLIYHRALRIDSVVVDKPEVSIFADQTKPRDKNKFPPYFGQQLGKLHMPLLIKQVKVTNVTLVNEERKRDSSYAKVAIRRGTVVVRNIANRSRKPMTLHAQAFINDKVHFDVELGFSYLKPEFSLKGVLSKFSLTDLNPVLQAYTPAMITSGTADEITFSGTLYETKATGTMKFLYHDLKVDLELQNKAKWKSAVIAFAANSVVNSSNPGSASLPPREVQFEVKRDMNKGFINLILKSVLMGIKETMIMSKENRKSYKEAKKKQKAGK